jgi:hypothetical protein
MTKKKPKAGRPSKEETTTLSIRIPLALKKELMGAYKGKLNKMIIGYLEAINPLG